MKQLTTLKKLTNLANWREKMKNNGQIKKNEDKNGKIVRENKKFKKSKKIKKSIFFIFFW